ncbi:hypothetical protein NUW58_g3706 [Xylaria curta]|uniref:Uncharacterized protein n=1 Tax=Xylaria curta TaxID=42375 RepID=A0ACC1PB89_9PEZI|nr:hypothetical protein NUW58_g3706 [Xylaria curta]
MPTEVISLLSSSPVRPLHATVATSPETRERNGSRVLRRDLDRDVQSPTRADTAKNPTPQLSRTRTQPVVGIKRTSGHQISYHDDDFLFLSDDFDTTGDLDASYCKKARTSLGLSHRRKNDNDSDSLFVSDHSDTTGDPDASSHKKPQPSAALLHRSRSGDDSASLRNTKPPMAPSSRRNLPSKKRWGNVVEDIEFSSSPADLAPSGAAERVLEISSDPFASPREEIVRISTSCKPVSVNSLHSSPKTANEIVGQGTWNWPAELRSGQLAEGGHETQPSSKTTFIDLLSDPIDSPPQRKAKSNPSAARRKATWDPISSSAPETHDIQDLLSSPPISARSYPQPEAVALGDSSDSDDLPGLDDVDFAKIHATKHSHYSSSRPGARVSRQTTKKIGKSTEDKQREQIQKLEAREADKERKRIEKTRAREERALQKEKEKALAEVNKLRTDKKVSTPEMIVDIPMSINSGLKVQIEALLGDLNVQYETWNSTVEHVVKWRRKVTSRFDEEVGLWTPIPMRVKDENHILVIVQAAEFVKLALGEEGQDLEAHVLQMKSKFPNTKLIYLIEGLTAWMRKNRNLLNRQFASAVRNLGPSADSGSSSQRRHRNNQTQEYIDEDKIEDALLSLQVLHETLVHHTNAPVETAQWIAVFTQHISTIPYRKARDASADAGFCMESGQVRTGDGVQDTYIRMLQAITRLTPPIAYGIVTEYDSVTDLIRGLEETGPLALAECRKSANKDGALADSTIGQAMSKRLHKIFLCQDPASTDV